jgi:hypothetical protein
VRRLACVDFGSTWTKAALVAPATGELLATRQAPTTPQDVVAGVLAATACWAAPVRAWPPPGPTSSRWSAGPTAGMPRCCRPTRPAGLLRRLLVG